MPAVNHLEGDWTAGIADYDKLHVQILGMADMLTDGIVAQVRTSSPDPSSVRGQAYTGCPPSHERPAMSTVAPHISAPAHPVEARLLARILAVLSGIAAAIHAAAVPEHLEEAWLFGAFFVALTAFQAGWALAIVRRPTPVVAMVGMAASAAVIVVWVLSRTTGMPIGPHPGVPEAVGTLDVASTLAELGVVALAFGIPATSPHD